MRRLGRLSLRIVRIRDRCAMGESNSRLIVGNDTFYHLTNGASKNMNRMVNKVFCYLVYISFQKNPALL